MKKIIFITFAAFSIHPSAYADGVFINYEVFRKKLLSGFKQSANQEIIFKRILGQSYSRESVEHCEVQLKSSTTETRIDIIFPSSNHSQVTVEFSYSREISEHLDNNGLKYSSHYVSCRGDQYDNYRDCWEYDHYEMMLESGIEYVNDSITVSIKGQKCEIKI
jgi:hypothetical protein